MKKILLGLLACAAALCFTSCGNYQLVDTVYRYDYAIICLPNGETVEGSIESWTDYEGEQLQIKIDGRYYLAHSANVVLIAEPAEESENA